MDQQSTSAEELRLGEANEAEQSSAAETSSRGRSYLIVATVLLFLGGGGGAIFWYATRGEGESQGQQPAPVSVEVANAEQEAWSLRRTAVGTITATQQARLTSERAGKVVEIAFTSGSRVEAGELLVRLDTTTEEAELGSMEPQLRQARSDQQRAVQLRAENAISEEAYEQAFTAVDQLEARIAKQKAIISQKRIVAPFAGKLGIREIDLGDYLAPGSAVTTLQQLDPILVDFPLPEQDANDVAVGQPIEVSVAAYPETRFSGKIRAITPRVERATRSFTVRGELPNEERRLQPGMFAQVVIDLPEERTVVSVPQTAIAFNAYGASLFYLESSDSAPSEAETSPSEAETSDDASATDTGSGSEASSAASQGDAIAKQVFVQTGERRGLSIEIVEGIEAGKRVVTAGQLKLSDGSPVRIREQISRQTIPVRPTQP